MTRNYCGVSLWLFAKISLWFSLQPVLVWKSARFGEALVCQWPRNSTCSLADVVCRTRRFWRSNKMLTLWTSVVLTLRMPAGLLLLSYYRLEESCCRLRLNAALVCLNWAVKPLQMRTLMVVERNVVLPVAILFIIVAVSCVMSLLTVLVILWSEKTKYGCARHGEKNFFLW